MVEASFIRTSFCSRLGPCFGHNPRVGQHTWQRISKTQRQSKQSCFFVFAGCSDTVRSAGAVTVEGGADSEDEGADSPDTPAQTPACRRCNVFIEAPDSQNIVLLNVTGVFRSTEVTENDRDDVTPSLFVTSRRTSSPASDVTSSCTPKVGVMEVTPSGRERVLDSLLLPARGKLFAPQALESHTHLLKVTLTYPPDRASRHVGFNLDVSFAQRRGEFVAFCSLRKTTSISVFCFSVPVAWPLCGRNWRGVLARIVSRTQHCQ